MIIRNYLINPRGRAAGSMTPFAALLLLSLSSVAAGQLNERIGHAYEPESGLLIYTEHHEKTYAAGRLVHDQVTYKDATGDVIATKEVDYRRNKYLPAFLLENSRTGHLESGRAEAGRYIVSFRASRSDPMRESELDVPPGAIADAGFDRFVVDNWQRLKMGEVMTCEFLVPSKAKFVRFRIRVVNDMPDATSLVVEPASPLLRLLADPLRLTYEGETPELRSFTGISNMRDDNGSNYVVRIDFAENEGQFAAGEAATIRLAD